MLHVTCTTNWETIAALSVAWNHLLHPGNPFTPFLRYEWVRHWFEAYGAGCKPFVLIATQGPHLCGILPLRLSQSRFARRPILRLNLMVNGHSPCGDLVSDPVQTRAVCEAFADHLQGSSAWDEIALCEMQGSSRLARMVSFFPASRRLERPQRRSPFLALEGGWDDYRQQLSKNFLKALRNNRNRVARYGPAKVELLEQPENLEAGLVDAFTIGERSWQGAEGSAIGSTPENRLFYSSLVRELGPQGLVRLWFLRLGGRRVAFELHVAHAGVEFGLKTGYDRDFEDLNVGTYLDQHIVRHLLEEKRYREYDLLGNADFYKLRWTHRCRGYSRALIFGDSLSGRLLSHWNRWSKRLSSRLHRCPA